MKCTPGVVVLLVGIFFESWLCRPSSNGSLHRRAGPGSQFPIKRGEEYLQYELVVDKEKVSEFENDLRFVRQYSESIDFLRQFVRDIESGVSRLEERVRSVENMRRNIQRQYVEELLELKNGGTVEERKRLGDEYDGNTSAMGTYPDSDERRRLDDIKVALKDAQKTVLEYAEAKQSWTTCISGTKINGYRKLETGMANLLDVGGLDIEIPT